MVENENTNVPQNKDSVSKFCQMIRTRSQENRNALMCIRSIVAVISPLISILRQELDSMIRVIYLLSLRNLDERVRLIESTLAGNKWRIQTSNGKYREVTDKDMVVLAQQLQYWTQSVYKFGCGFIHLSNYHNYSCENPFDRLASSEQQDILRHMRYYHGGPETDKPSLIELANYIPAIFEKISSNLECYLKELENNEFIEIK